MARNDEMRKRVERLLAEGFRHDDITKLLLWLRERSYGVSSIREIGDFVAHSDTKTKGAVTQELRDFFRYLELRMNSTNLNEQGKKPAFLQIKLENLPPDFPSIVMERFRKLDSSEINRTTGLNRKAAELALKAVLQKFSTGPNGELSLTSARTKDEAAILTTSLNSMMPTPTLTQAALWRDFCFVLKKNNLLEDREQKLLKPVERGLVLFSIATMHGTEMTLVSGRVAKLSAGIRKNGNLCVAAAGEWDMIGAFGSAVVPVFDTDLLASECCDPALSVDAGNKYNEPLDVSADLRLVAL